MVGVGIDVVVDVTVIVAFTAVVLAAATITEIVVVLGARVRLATMWPLPCGLS